MLVELSEKMHNIEWKNAGIPILLLRGSDWESPGRIGSHQWSGLLYDCDHYNIWSQVFWGVCFEPGGYLCTMCDAGSSLFFKSTVQFLVLLETEFLDIFLSIYIYSVLCIFSLNIYSLYLNNVEIIEWHNLQLFSPDNCFHFT